MAGRPGDWISFYRVASFWLLAAGFWLYSPFTIHPARTNVRYGQAFTIL
jgi:hypothetical protein